MTLLVKSHFEYLSRDTSCRMRIYLSVLERSIMRRTPTTCAKEFHPANRMRAVCSTGFTISLRAVLSDKCLAITAHVSAVRAERREMQFCERLRKAACSNQNSLSANKSPLFAAAKAISTVRPLKGLVVK